MLASAGVASRRHLRSAALAAGALAIAGCGSGGDARACDGYDPAPGFWQSAQAADRERAADRVREIVRCAELEGETERAVERQLGPHVPMRDLGGSDGDAFRIWSGPEGPGVRVEFGGPGRTASVVECWDRAIDRDVWDEPDLCE